MGQYTGMDIGEVRSLAAQLQNAGNEIQQIANRLTSQLEGTPWVGPDRERFVADWRGQHKAGLMQISQALQTASQMATKNANDQEAASSN